MTRMPFKRKHGNFLTEKGSFLLIPRLVKKPDRKRNYTDTTRKGKGTEKQTSSSEPNTETENMVKIDPKLQETFGTKANECN